jgi:hypothetical protein
MAAIVRSAPGKTPPTGGSCSALLETAGQRWLIDSGPLDFPRPFAAFERHPLGLDFHVTAVSCLAMPKFLSLVSPRFESRPNGGKPFQTKRPRLEVNIT